MSVKRRAVPKNPIEYKLLEKELEILIERRTLIENEKKAVLEMIEDIKEKHESIEKISSEGVENEKNEENLESTVNKLKQVFKKFIEHL